MAYSMEYSIQKNDIDPLSNIGRAPISILISFIRNPHACSQATKTIGILELKAIVNILMHCVRHLREEAINLLTYALQNVINTIKQPFQYAINSCNKKYSNISKQTLKCKTQVLLF